jgi:carbon-monoxide dehydrogenase medium subunit
LEEDEMHNFEFVKPTTIADAVKALSSDEAQALGGGQTLIPTMKQRLASPETLVSLTGIGEMLGVCLSDAGEVCIGGASTHASVASETATSYPGLSGLANNDPAACYPAVALASGATIKTDAREIAADDYFEGMFSTALEEGEIITEVRFPVPEVSNYQKFVQPASRFAMVGVFVAKYADGVRVAVTGASDEGVYRWSEAEAALSANFSAAAIEGLSVSADGMIADLHGSSAYRAHLVKVMTGRAVTAAS